MITPIVKKVSKSILDYLEIDKIIYAEVTPPGAMGNTGGIIIYIRKDESEKMLCLETNIFEDEETYLMAEEIIFKNLYNKENLNFYFYYGGMGNYVYLNNKINFSIKGDHFVYHADHLEFQIFSSVQGVFNNVVNEMNRLQAGDEVIYKMPRDNS